MLCPRCGAYSPYNTAVCNRCGTKLAGEKAGKSPRRSRSQQFYRRAQKSDWEKSRDQLLAKANDKIEGIMADQSKRRLLIGAVIAAAVVLLGSMIGCVSCACGSCACGSCACGESLPAVSQSDVPTDNSDGGDGFSMLHGFLGDKESQPGSGTSGADVSGSDAASHTDTADTRQ